MKCKSSGDSAYTDLQSQDQCVADMMMAVLVMMVLEVKMVLVAQARKTVTEWTSLEGNLRGSLQPCHVSAPSHAAHNHHHDDGALEVVLRSLPL